MKCLGCNHCIEDGFSAEMGSMTVFQGVGEFYCEIQNQLHYICNIQELRTKECIHRKCIKCGRPDPRVNNQAREFCTECKTVMLDVACDEAFEDKQDDISPVIDWGKIIEKR
jgi:endogenous inhibitor of DNA gyrase (YacG/DUF329 family)